MVGEPWWLLLVFLFALSIVLRHQVLAFLTVLLALGSAASALSYRYCLHGVVYRRRLGDRRIFSGQETTLTIEVTNAKPLPLPWLVVRDHIPEGLALTYQEEDPRDGQAQEISAPVLRELFVLRWYESAQRFYRVRGSQRGAYAFDAASLSAGNLFGLENQSKPVDQVDRLIVYPKVVPVEHLGLPFDRPGGESRALRRIVEDPLRIAHVRDYIPGDSARYIHWKNSARCERLQTKVFDPEASPVLTLYADVQTTPDPYSLVREYLELIIVAAGSLAIHALGLRQSVGLCVNGGPADTQHWTSIAPGRHPEQGARILEALALLNGFRTLALSHLLYRSLRTLPYGSTVVAITSRTTEPVLLALLALQRAGHPTVLITVGDRRPRVPERFTTYHIGGRDAWRHLTALALA